MLATKFYPGTLLLVWIFSTMIWYESLKRPQNPRPPFPYLSENVEFLSQGLLFKGTVTRPKTPGLHKSIVLITGSGPLNRDEEILGHKPFLVLSQIMHDQRQRAFDMAGFTKDHSKKLQDSRQKLVNLACHQGSDLAILKESLNLARISLPIVKPLNKEDQNQRKPSLDLIQTSLANAGNHQVTIHSLPNLNHLFQKAVSGEVSEYAIIEETINPSVLKIIAEWL